MKTVFQKMFIVVLVAITLSCTKESVADENSTCYVCATEEISIDVCIKEDGDFLVAGETVSNPNNATLEDYVRNFEAYHNNEPVLEGISCSRK